ncbi:GATA zinc finger domain-containing protein 14-like [Helianthus annuus]|uniref:GATA zinc finger domain-containing protein 14-like n=1 Tax=Helianthus annuus TaxID=4232 RepID=UPI000B8F98D7|nr:GATA zinc finger domain-containing protein 14-like [Helianthus annuus]
MGNQTLNQSNNQHQHQYQDYPPQNQNNCNNQSGGSNNQRPPTPPHLTHTQNLRQNQRAPTPPNQNRPQNQRQNPLPPNPNNRNVNPNHGANQNCGNPTNEPQILDPKELRNNISDAKPYSVLGYHSPERVSVHSEYSGGDGNYEYRNFNGFEDDGWDEYDNNGNF